MTRRAAVVAAWLASSIACGDPGPAPWPLTSSFPAARRAFLEGLDEFNRLRNDAARAAFGRAVEADPGFAVAHAYLALAMNSSGDVAGTIAAAERALAGATSEERLVVESRKAWIGYDYRGAIAGLGELVGKNPDSRQAHLELSVLQRRAREPDAAVESAAKAVALDEGYAPARVHLAHALLAAGQLEAAKQAALRAAELAPGEPLPHYVLGEVEKQAGRLDEAEAAYTRAIERDPGHVPAYQGRAYSLRLKERFAEARQDFRQAFEITAALPDAAYKELMYDWNKAEDTSFDVAVSHLLEGDVAAAIEAARETVEYVEAVRPANAAFYHDALGRMLLEDGQLEPAHEAYRAGAASIERAELSDQDRQLWHGRFVHGQARIMAKAGRFDEALARAAKIGQMIEAAGAAGDPYRPSLHYLMGYIRLEQEDYAAAVTELEQADRRDEFVLWLLARAYRGAGERENATAVVERLRRSSSAGFRSALVRRHVLAWEDAPTGPGG